MKIRPIETSDTDGLERFFYRLSPDTVYRRFFSPVVKPRRSLLEHLATVDHDRRDALVAVDDHDEIIAVARYDATDGLPNTAEVAVVVEDDWQRHGVASVLLNALAKLAAERGYSVFTASMLGDNRPAAQLVRALNPRAQLRWDGGTMAALLPLDRSA